jgi:hypothetical protein
MEERKDSRRNEAIAFLSEEMIKMEIESEGYIVTRVTDVIHHKLNSKEIRNNFNGEADKIIPILSALIERRLQMPDFICKHIGTNKIVFVEFKDWKKYKLNQVKQKESLSEIQRLGGYLTMIINKFSIFKVYGEDFLPFFDERFVQSILEIKKNEGVLPSNLKQIFSESTPNFKTKGYTLIDTIRKEYYP